MAVCAVSKPTPADGAAPAGPGQGDPRPPRLPSRWPRHQCLGVNRQVEHPSTIYIPIYCHYVYIYRVYRVNSNIFIKCWNRSFIYIPHYLSICQHISCRYVYLSQSTICITIYLLTLCLSLSTIYMSIYLLPILQSIYYLYYNLSTVYMSIDLLSMFLSVFHIHTYITNTDPDWYIVRQRYESHKNNFISLYLHTADFI